MRDDSKVIPHHVNESSQQKIGCRWYTCNHIYIYASIDMADNTAPAKIIHRSSVFLRDYIITFLQMYASVQCESSFRNNWINDGREEIVFFFCCKEKEK